MDSCDVRISTAIMTHPRRAREARRLIADHPELYAKLVVDPEPEGPPSPMRTARLAWRAVRAGATHHLVIQDDAILCSNFLAHVKGRVAARPRDALSLYTEWGSAASYIVRLAALAGKPWAQITGDYTPAVALVLPADVAIGLSEFMVSECALDESDDEAICRYLARLQVQSFISVPNLVDHIGTASLVGNGYLGDRPSACFIPNPPSPNPRMAQSAFFPQVTYLPQSWRSARPVHPERNPFAATYDWQPLPAAHIVRLRQLSRRDLVDAMAGTIESVMPGRPMRKADFAHSRMYDLWLVSYMLGFALADKAESVRVGTLATALSRPLAAHALSTLPGGILREFVGSLELDRFRPLFDSLVRRGVTYGFTGMLPEAEGRLKWGC